MLAPAATGGEGRRRPGLEPGHQDLVIGDLDETLTAQNLGHNWDDTPPLGPIVFDRHSPRLLLQQRCRLTGQDGVLRGGRQPDRLQEAAHAADRLAQTAGRVKRPFRHTDQRILWRNRPSIRLNRSQARLVGVVWGFRVDAPGCVAPTPGHRQGSATSFTTHGSARALATLRIAAPEKPSGRGTGSPRDPRSQQEGH